MGRKKKIGAWVAAVILGMGAFAVPYTTWAYVEEDDDECVTGGEVYEYLYSTTKMDFGHENIAGFMAIATGALNTARDYATAVGLYNIASGQIALAVGMDNLASGAAGIAVGVRNSAVGYASFAVGGTNYAFGENSGAFGYNNVVGAGAFDEDGNLTEIDSKKGQSAYAFGASNIVKANKAVALGIGNFIGDTTKEGAETGAEANTVVLGLNNRFTAANALVLGTGVTGTVGDGAIILGKNITGSVAANSIVIGDGSTSEDVNTVSVGAAAVKDGETVKTAEVTRRIVHVAEGTNATDAVNKNQLDEAIAGNQYKGSDTVSIATEVAYERDANGNYVLDDKGKKTVVYKKDTNGNDLIDETTEEKILETETVVRVKNMAQSTSEADEETNGNTKAQGENAVAFGVKSSATGDNASAFGYSNEVNGESASAFGAENKATGQQSSALGVCNTVTGEAATGIGGGNTAEGKWATAVGSLNTAASSYASSVGVFNKATGQQSSVFGFYNQVGGEGASAFGAYNIVGGAHASAFGYASRAEGAQSLALGLWTYAAEDGNVAIGYQAVANTAMTKEDANGNTVEEGGNTVTTVSFGHKSTDERYVVNKEKTGYELKAYGTTVLSRLTNVAVGKEDTDAVNFSQIKTAAGAYVQASLATDGSLNEKGTVGANLVALDTAIGAVDKDYTFIKKSVNTKDATENVSLATNLINLDVGIMKLISYDRESKTIKIGGGYTSDDAVSVSIGGRKMTGVANGTEDTDAVNYGQLKKAIADGTYEGSDTISIATEVAYKRDANGNELTDETTGEKIPETEKVVRVKNMAQSTSATDEETNGNTKATGTSALALGNYAEANGGRATAIGYESKATGAYAIALGYQNTAEGEKASAVGIQNQVKVSNAVAFGQSNKVYSPKSSAFGVENTAGDENAVLAASAFGYYNKAIKAKSSAFGYYNEASAENASAFGYYNTAKGNSSVAMGFQNNVYGANSAAFGFRNKVGESSGSGANAYVFGAGNAVTAGGTTEGTLGEGTYKIDGVVVVGTSNTVAGGSLILGNQNTVASAATNAIVIGSKITNVAPHSVVIGNGSTSEEANTVSVGNSTTQRKIVHVAYGGAAHDAVAYGQLIKGGNYTATSSGASAEQAVELEYNDSASGSTKVKISIAGEGEVVPNDKRLVNGGTVYEAIVKAASGGVYYEGSDTISIQAKVGSDHYTVSVKNMAQSTTNAVTTAPTATGTNAVALGAGGVASGAYAQALGTKAQATGRYSIALGYDAIAAENTDVTEDPGSTGSSIAIGTNTRATGNGTVVIGAVAEASGEEGIAIGSEAKSEGYEATAVGSGAYAKDKSTTAFGSVSAASGEAATAAGYQSKAEGMHAAAFGYYSQAINTAALAFGSLSTSSGIGSSAVGYWSMAGQNHDTALGNQSVASAGGATALGTWSHAYGVASNAIGYQSTANAGATAGTAIGYQSVAKTGLANENGNLVATVSFGHANGDSYTTVNANGEHVSATYSGNLYSRLTNVADGKENTDAATYGQLVNAQKQADGTYKAYELKPGEETEIKNNAGGTAFKLKLTLDSGEIVDQNGGYITGGDLYKELRPTEAGHYIGKTKEVGGEPVPYTTGENLKALDDAIGEVEKNGNVIEATMQNGKLVTTVSQNLEKLDGKIGKLAEDGKVIKADASVSQNLVNLDNAIKDTGVVDLGKLKEITREATASATGENAVALGDKSDANAADTVAIGSHAAASGANSIAIGKGSTVTGDDSIAVGTRHTVCGSNSGAFGDPDNVHGHDSYAVGNNNVIGDHSRDGEAGNNTFVLGNHVTTTANNAVVLGNHSTAEEDNVVSVGSDENQRKIIHVAPGEKDTDAVNVGQLKGTMLGITSDLETKINKVGAGAAALAALHPEGYDPADRWSFAVGYGHYRNANAGAFGAFYKPNFDTTLSFGGTIGNGDAMMNAGVSFKLGTRGKDAELYQSGAALAREVGSLRKSHDKLTADNESLRKDNEAQTKRIESLEADNERIKADNAKMKEQIAMILSKMEMSEAVEKTAAAEETAAK